MGSGSFEARTRPVLGYPDSGFRRRWFQSRITSDRYAENSRRRRTGRNHDVLHHPQRRTDRNPADTTQRPPTSPRTDRYLPPRSGGQPSFWSKAALFIALIALIWDAMRHISRYAAAPERRLAKSLALASEER